MGLASYRYSTPSYRRGKTIRICASSAHIPTVFGHTICEVFIMSYVSPKLRPRFESLSVDLKNEILRRDVRLENLHDLIAVLESIVTEAEAAP